MYMYSEMAYIYILFPSINANNLQRSIDSTSVDWRSVDCWPHPPLTPLSQAAKIRGSSVLSVWPWTFNFGMRSHVLEGHRRRNDLSQVGMCGMCRGDSHHGELSHHNIVSSVSSRTRHERWRENSHGQICFSPGENLRPYYALDRVLCSIRTGFNA